MELHGETNDPCDPEKIREGDEIPQPSVCFLPRMLSRAALRYLEKCCHFHEMFNSGWYLRFLLTAYDLYKPKAKIAVFATNMINTGPLNAQS